MVIINCESEPVSKTPEFNKLVNTVTGTLLAKEAGDFTGEAIVELDGIKDSLAQAIGLLKENIQIKSGKVKRTLKRLSNGEDEYFMNIFRLSLLQI